MKDITDLENGKFKHPYGLRIDKQGKIVVVDETRDDVQIFTSEGQFLMRFGGRGENNGEFRSPTRATITQDGDIVIADSSNHRVQFFG